MSEEVNEKNCRVRNARSVYLHYISTSILSNLLMQKLTSGVTLSSSSL